MSKTNEPNVVAGFTYNSLPFIVVGLILILAGSHWFPKAVTVGWILFAVGVFPIALLTVVVLIALLIAIYGNIRG